MKRDSPVAVIDVGSNSIRCLIAKPENNNLKILKRELVTTRLGRGLSEEKILNEEAIKKSLETLEYYLNLVNAFDAELCRVIGTSALRQAQNAGEFIELVKNKLKITIEVVSGESEAALTCKGALYDKDLESHLVFDLGGGSLELISQKPYFVKSLNIGAVNALESFGYSKESNSINLLELYNIVVKELEQVVKEYPESCQKENLVGVGGTATSLAMLTQGLEAYDENKIQDYYLSRFEVYKITSKLNSLSLEERKNVKGIPKNREDIIVSGGGIIWSMLEYLEYDGYYSSDKDLMYGMIYEELFDR